jgi:hypothetical protein
VAVAVFNGGEGVVALSLLSMSCVMPGIPDFLTIPARTGFPDSL